MESTDRNTSPDNKVDMTTLVSVMTRLRESGYTVSFSVDDNGLRAQNIEKVYQPEEVKIVNFYRFEGESDPGDNSILYAVETSDGLKGVLTDAYGAYGDAKTDEFVTRVEEISKKEHTMKEPNPGGGN